MTHCYKVENAGYKAQSEGALLSHNPYEPESQKHWDWRKGWLEAFKDSN